MLIFSINVNGLRAFDQKNGGDFNEFCLNNLKADILCLQEIKGSSSSLSKYHTLKDYQTFSSFYEKGRHGVSTLVRKTLFCGKTEEVVPGRILKTYHGNFVIFNCYLPYYDETKEGDKTEIIKIYEILKENLKEEKQTIVCGDFNAVYNMLDHYMFKEELERLSNIEKWVEHSQISQCIDFNKSNINSNCTNNINSNNSNNNIKINERMKLYEKLKEHELEYGVPIKDRTEKIKPSKTELPFYFFSIKELEKYFFEIYQRAWMRDIVSTYIDTFRLYDDRLSQYTCWNVMLNLRPVNLGTRIDYILCSKDLKCIRAGIMPELKGSDHCPVFSEFDICLYEEEESNLVKKKNNLFSFFQTKRT